MKAVIFGISGQDGSYLAEFLLEKEYDVIGVIRRSSSSNTSRVDHLISHENMTLVEGDITDLSNVYKDDSCEQNISQDNYLNFDI